MTRASKMAFLQSICTGLLLFASLVEAGAQGHAPYSMLSYQTNDRQGDILVTEIRPTISAPYTYFNALNWKGGYTGLQMTGDGKTQFIFSIWDPPGTESAPAIGFVYNARGGVIDRFGGEGTGLHYMNKQTTWQANHWYRIVVRCWDHVHATRYSLWSQDEQTGVWTHHITMESPEDHFRFGRVASFMEDWQGTPNLKRRVEYRGTYIRDFVGHWYALGDAKFSVAHNFTGPGKFSNAFDAGVSGNAFFIQAGGDTKPTLTDDENLSVMPAATSSEKAIESPTPGTPETQIIELTAKSKKETLVAKWKLDASTAPQFAYKLRVFSDEQMQGNPLAESQSEIGPDDREATVQLTATTREPIYLKLTVIDIFDRQVSTTVRVTE